MVKFDQKIQEELISIRKLTTAYQTEFEKRELEVYERSIKLMVDTIRENKWLQGSWDYIDGNLYSKDRDNLPMVIKLAKELHLMHIFIPLLNGTLYITTSKLMLNVPKDDLDDLCDQYGVAIDHPLELLVDAAEELSIMLNSDKTPSMEEYKKTLANMTRVINEIRDRK